MKSRYLMLTCLSLVIGSVFIAPGFVYLGMDMDTSKALSSALLLACIVFAILAVRADNEDYENREISGKRP